MTICKIRKIVVVSRNLALQKFETSQLRTEKTLSTRLWRCVLSKLSRIQMSLLEFFNILQIPRRSFKKSLLHGSKH